MSFNNRDNINKPKIYVNPFTSKNKQNNKSFNKSNKQDPKKPYIKYNPQNNRSIQYNPQNSRANQYNPQNNRSKSYKPNYRKSNTVFDVYPPIDNKKDNLSLFPGSIESIEIIPINPVDGSIKNGSGLKMEPGTDMFHNFLKNILFKNNVKEEKKPDIPALPEFSIDLTKEYEEITKPIKSIDDLIELGKSYDPETADKYAINLKRLSLLVDPLMELKNTIGMDSVKNSIVDQIVYFLQAFEENNNMLHTIIEGPPGVGKTMLGYILGKIYYNMGVLKGSQNAVNSLTGKKDNFVFKIVKRKDLIGEYLGHTAVKTQKVIDECKGGVLFIDEAYSLGNTDKKDTYSKECIDTINQNLSENKNNFMCIIAGYPEQLEQCFFSYNEGLKRRFTFKYSIEKYTGKELSSIFRKMVKDSTWELDVKEEELDEFITKNLKEFENFGGDMETLLFRTKITHSKRVFGKHPRNKKKITMEDILSAFKLFVSHKKKDTSFQLSEEVLRNIYT
jgi:SpoVK/Ycf46/Vps4 family AAA+-type ATPase